MAELSADLALGFDTVGPVDNRAVAGTAPVRGDLLDPLVGSVHGMRPADGVVVEGIWRAELVDPRRHELGRLDIPRPVERDHPVERAGQPTPDAGAIVTGDVDDQRVVEDMQVFQGVDHPTHLVVGVLHVAGVDLHLPRQHGLQYLRHVVPGGDLLRPYSQLGVGGDDSQLISGGRRSPRAACPSPGRSCPCRPCSPGRYHACGEARPRSIQPESCAA